MAEPNRIFGSMQDSLMAKMFDSIAHPVFASQFRSCQWVLLTVPNKDKTFVPCYHSFLKLIWVMLPHDEQLCDLQTDKILTKN